jgi:serine/threonine-protein kinase RsbT
VNTSVVKQQVLPLQAEQDVVKARQTVRQWAEGLKFSLVDQTKLVTAASELARNTIVYGGGGRMRLEILDEGKRIGLRLVFEDEGPGITNVELALQDGFTTGQGLGLGLGGAKRLVNEFRIESQIGKGTRVAVARWK